jgi:hypothetical protein
MELMLICQSERIVIDDVKGIDRCLGTATFGEFAWGPQENVSQDRFVSGLGLIRDLVDAKWVLNFLIVTHVAVLGQPE